MKTKETGASVTEFLDRVADSSRRADAFRVLEMFRKATGEEPRIWGSSIIGFGRQVLKYDSGRELDWMITGFSPRKTCLTLYVLNGSPSQLELLGKLGKHKTGKGCLYINKLSDVDVDVLEKLIRDSSAKKLK
ncbi:MAG: DUF1801 domain-containing protein [Pyrinomonadaceae bacterium]